MKSSQMGVPRLWTSVFIVKSVQGTAGFLRKGMGPMLARGELRLLGAGMLGAGTLGAGTLGAGKAGVTR